MSRFFTVARRYQRLDRLFEPRQTNDPSSLAHRVLPAPLAGHLDVLPEILDVYRPEDMIVVKDVSAEWPVNWKITLDAFMEGYHAHQRHPELIRLIDDYHFRNDLFGRGHSTMIIPFAFKSPRIADQDTMTPDADLSGTAPRRERRRIRHREAGPGAALDQDGEQLPLVQQGVRSRGFGGLRLS